MKVPKSIKIGSYTVPVSFITDKMDDASRGCYDTIKTKILLRDDLSPQQKFSVFVHEYLEGWNDLFGLELDEKTILSLEQGVTSLIKQLKEE